MSSVVKCLSAVARLDFSKQNNQIKMNETSTIIATTSTIDTDAGNTETLTPIVCKYCQQPENKQYKPCLVCEKCKCAVHLICLRRPGTPGDIDGDVFFDFTCLECSPTKEELFERNKFPW